MLHEIPSSMWLEWIAYMQIEPLGTDQYALQQVAGLTALQYNHKYKVTTPKSARDFTPQFRQSIKEQRRRFTTQQEREIDRQMSRFKKPKL